jgi:hypothetical protein
LDGAPARSCITTGVRVPEIPDRTFPGKVSRIADALDPATRTLTTEIDVPNPDGAKYGFARRGSPAEPWHSRLAGFIKRNFTQIYIS